MYTTSVISPEPRRNASIALREAFPNLKSVALFDRLEREPPDDAYARIIMWRRREIENYLCSEKTLEQYALGSVDQEMGGQPLFAISERERRMNAMHESIKQVSEAMETLGLGSPWGADAKVSDDFLTPLFERYFEKLQLPNLMNKKDFYELAEYVPLDEIDDEVAEKLDMIAEVAAQATPAPL